MKTSPMACLAQLPGGIQKQCLSWRENVVGKVLRHKCDPQSPSEGKTGCGGVYKISALGRQPQLRPWNLFPRQPVLLSDLQVTKRLYVLKQGGQYLMRASKVDFWPAWHRHGCIPAPDLYHSRRSVHACTGSLEKLHTRADVGVGGPGAKRDREEKLRINATVCRRLSQVSSCELSCVV